MSRRRGILPARTDEQEEASCLFTTGDGRHPYITPLNAPSHDDLTYVHNPGLTHGLPQFTRYSKACQQATDELADLIRARIG